MPEHPRFQVELADCPDRSFAETCVRVVELEAFLKAGTPTLLFDLGPKISNGGLRFSPPGDHRGLYVSTELMTAGSEFAGSRKAWNAGLCANHVTFQMAVQLASVRDLTDASVRRHLAIRRPEVLSQWKGFAQLNGGAWPPTWTLGHEAFVSARIDGILSPSNRNPSGRCLLIFTDRLVAGETHVIISRQDDSPWERLP